MNLSDSPPPGLPTSVDIKDSESLGDMFFKKRWKSRRSSATDGLLKSSRFPSTGWSTIDVQTYFPKNDDFGGNHGAIGQ